jgi:hypothetical protein
MFKIIKKCDNFDKEDKTMTGTAANRSKKIYDFQTCLKLG